MRVRVYRNLHTKSLSMQTYTKGVGWRVYSHPDAVLIKQAKFIVYESGRQRVLKERRKSVHAYIEGYVGQMPDRAHDLQYYTGKASYNPYKGPDWTDQNGRQVHRADFAYVKSSGVEFIPRTIEGC